jgi:hypothetical protein
MGGYGSTRWRRHRNARTVGTCVALDSSILRGIVPGRPARGRCCFVARAAAPRVHAEWELDYANGGPWLLVASGDGQDRRQHRIGLTFRGLPYGGVRWYLHCPVPRAGGGVCDQRVTKLFWPILPPFGLGCRACHHLVYESSQGHRTLRDWILRGDFDRAWAWLGVTPDERERFNSGRHRSVP